MEGAGEANRFDSDTAVAILLAVAAAVAALIGARAAVIGDSGSDTWHTSIRHDVKRGAGINEDADYLYAAEGSLLLQIIEAQVRSEESLAAARKASGPARVALEAEGRAQADVVETLLPAGRLVDDAQEAVSLDGEELARALARQRAANPESLREVDPDATEERGAELNRKSALLVASAIPAALAFFLGALAEGFPRRRRLLVPVGYGLAAVSFVLALILELSL